MFGKDKVLKERIQNALNIAWSCGQIDGSNHKMWVIDQMVRALCGNEESYKKWVAAYEIPVNYKEDDYYSWDTGTAP